MMLNPKNMNAVNPMNQKIFVRLGSKKFIRCAQFMVMA